VTIALGQENSTTVIPSLNNRSKISEVTQNNFVLRYITTQSLGHNRAYVNITDGADGCSKLCNNRKFLQWSLAYMWTKKCQAIDDITRLELPVTHYLREMYTMNAYSASEGTKIDSIKFAIGNIYEKLKVYFFFISINLNLIPAHSI
jgi:hypothetical protein